MMKKLCGMVAVLGLEVAGGALLADCASVVPTLQRRASYDLSCPQERVRIVDLGGGLYRTSCGPYAATYACTMPDNAGLVTEPTCRREAGP